jgi:tetratricopeptide (TPR) repeat protein
MDELGRSIHQAVNLALERQKANRLLDAAAIYRSILKLQPRHFDALQLLGVVCHRLGDHHQAIELMRRALQVDPFIATVHTNLGEAYRELNRLDEAVHCYKTAIALKPDAAPAHNNLGLALLDRGDLKGATGSFEKALVLNPHLPAVSANLGRTHLCRRNFAAGLWMILKKTGFIRFTQEPSFKLISRPADATP